jgi:hypothetical protein
VRKISRKLVLGYYVCELLLAQLVARQVVALSVTCSNHVEEKHTHQAPVIQWFKNTRLLEVIVYREVVGSNPTGSVLKRKDIK